MPVSGFGMIHMDFHCPDAGFYVLVDKSLKNIPVFLQNGL
jgi:hypothetical protein